MNAPAGAEGGMRPLLADLLTPLRRAGDTPLQFDLDTAGIAAWALRREAARGGRGRDGAEAVAALEGLVAEALGGARRAGAAAGGIAAWLRELHAALRAAHPLAAEILARRLEGAEARAIAEELALGPRLVARILAAARGGVA